MHMPRLVHKQRTVVWPQVLLALFAFDDYTGFQVTQLLELPQPWSIIVVWGLVLPLIFLAASALTNIVLKDALILKVGESCALACCFQHACHWHAD